MGCDSPGSNFNAMVYDNGVWGCSFGPLSFEAPNEVLVRSAMARLELNAAEWDIYFDENRRTWRATPKSDTLKTSQRR